MDLQEKYDQLENLIDSLNSIIDDLDMQEMNDYILELTETKMRAEEELKEVEEMLKPQFEREYLGQEYEYERSCCCG